MDNKKCAQNLSFASTLAIPCNAGRNSQYQYARYETLGSLVSSKMGNSLSST